MSTRLELDPTAQPIAGPWRNIRTHRPDVYSRRWLLARMGGSEARFMWLLDRCGRDGVPTNNTTWYVAAALSVRLSPTGWLVDHSSVGFMLLLLPSAAYMDPGTPLVLVQVTCTVHTYEVLAEVDRPPASDSAKQGRSMRSDRTSGKSALDVTIALPPCLARPPSIVVVLSAGTSQDRMHRHADQPAVRVAANTRNTGRSTVHGRVESSFLAAVAAVVSIVSVISGGRRVGVPVAPCPPSRSDELSVAALCA